MKKFHHFLFLFGLIIVAVPATHAQTLVCNQLVQASTESDGSIMVSSEMLIVAPSIIFGLEIELVDNANPTDTLSGVDFINLQLFQNTEYTFIVTDPDTENSCWGTLSIFSTACNDTTYISFIDDVGIDEIIVDVVLQEDQLLGSIQWSNSYDGNILQFSDAISGSMTVSQNNFNEVDPGLLNFAWFVPTENLYQAGDVLFSLRFDVLDNGSTEVAVAEAGIGIPIEITNQTDGFICLNSEPAQVTSNGAKVEGNLSRNEDLGCTANNPQPLQDWMVRISNASDTYFVNADEEGNYKRVVLPGDYTVTAFPYSSMWGFCDNDIAISLPSVGDEATADFVGTAVSFCPAMEVEISTPFLRRCFDNTYSISYCNYGTAEATDAYIEIELDDFLTVVSASEPFTQVGQTLTFDLGTVDLGCGTINLVVNVSCDAELGQTHCAVAEIFPQDPCGIALQGWTGPVIEVDATCDGDSIRFIVENTGLENMAAALEFIVVEDDVMTDIGDFILDATASVEYSFESNGSTFRFNAEQQVGFPFDEFATAFVEGCGTDEDGNISVGFINDYSLGDYLPYVDWDCQENIGSYDPNDKASFPEGYGEEHYVKNNQTIDYKIRFQNTGTDTAFRVVVVDTLSEYLDISTFRRTSASHAHTVSVEDRVATFTFEDILLVDSTANEAASHGFIKFKIDMLADLPDGTLIENEADIYFDFNDPIRTNTTFLEIGTDFIEDASVSTIDNPYNMDVVITPNPASTHSRISFSDHDFTDLRVEVNNIIGKRLIKTDLRDNTLDLSKYNLSNGTYMIRLVHADNLVFSGKLIVH